jgi:hypothetical protein
MEDCIGAWGYGDPALVMGEDRLEGAMGRDR